MVETVWCPGSECVGRCNLEVSAYMTYSFKVGLSESGGCGRKKLIMLGLGLASMSRYIPTQKQCLIWQWSLWWEMAQAPSFGLTDGYKAEPLPSWLQTSLS
uniref:Uncharacterized protein n=1 Tax=Arundo donax TaxID=35708 RepID=A0A0A9D3F3_ARUDO